MYNPYDGVSFSSKVLGVTHAHCNTQSTFDNLYNCGVRHFAISNYYPSKPLYPLSDTFEDVPEDAISSHNAEFAHFIGSINQLHLNGLGSTWSAGNSEETSPNMSWQQSCVNILKNLEYADAGGITINHPVWSGLSYGKVIELFDFDERVLGLEILNSQYTEEKLTQGLALWDKVLKTGRNCFGFAVPDHRCEYDTPFSGYESILAASTDYACLKAYRTGAFYSKIWNTNLDFTSISFASNTVSVATENAASIKFVSNNGSETTSGNSASYNVKSTDVYVRVEAENAENKIFSNAIIFKEYKEKNKMMQFFFC